MFIPKQFRIEDVQTMYGLMEKYSFAALFSQHNGEPYATHMPLFLQKEEGILYGHFARPNTQWKDIEGQNVLVVFQGPHSYISPSWYETNQAVPTWNYAAVHVYGKVVLITKEEELKESLSNLVDNYEKPDSSYQLAEVDNRYLEGLRKGIVGFKIIITKMEGKAKLCQNHSSHRRERVINELEKLQGEQNKLVAECMKGNMSSLEK
jgi:transcriptional regulator